MSSAGFSPAKFVLFWFPTTLSIEVFAPTFRLSWLKRKTNKQQIMGYKLITFDFTGTLMRFRKPPTVQYENIARLYGIEIKNKKAFHDNFKKASKFWSQHQSTLVGLCLYVSQYHFCQKKSFCLYLTA
jgi:hypothetical protein